MGKSTLPKLVETAITLRLAGYTISTISQRTGLSVSTLYRYFREYSVQPGQIKDSAIVAARKQMLEDSSFVDNLKLQIAASIEDDLALAEKIRDTIGLCLDQIQNDQRIPAPLKCRSLTALATTLRLTQEVQRRALNIDEYQKANQLQQLPELKVTLMTDEEVAKVQAKLNASDAEYGANENDLELENEGDELTA